MRVILIITPFPAMFFLGNFLAIDLSPIQVLPVGFVLPILGILLNRRAYATTRAAIARFGPGREANPMVRKMLVLKMRERERIAISVLPLVLLLGVYSYSPSVWLFSLVGWFLVIFLDWLNDYRVSKGWKHTSS